MRVSRKKIAEVITERLEAGENPAKLSREVAAYLLIENRSKELESIMRDVILMRAETGLVEVSVVSAHALENQVKKDITSLVKSIKPEAKKVLIDERLDTDLIGGVKLSVINQSLDISIRAKLNQLKLSNLEGVS